MFDEEGLGHYGTDAARARKSDEGRDERQTIPGGNVSGGRNGRHLTGLSQSKVDSAS